MGGGEASDAWAWRPSDTRSDLNYDYNSEEWLEQSLFGLLLDHQELPPETLQPLLDQVWGLHGRFRITHSLKKKFIFHFDKKEERDLVLEDTPWAVSGMFLMLKPLSNEMGIDLEELKMDTTPIWMQIRGLPLELLSPTVGEIFGATAGELVNVERNGRFMKMYIRVRIRIDPEVPVVPGVFLKLFREERTIWVEFRYERVFKLCYNCGRIGHVKKKCDLTPEEAERRVGERVEESGRGKGLEYVVERGRPMYSRRVRAHRGKGRRKSNRMIIFDEEDGMPAIEADFDDDQDPPLTKYVMRRKERGGGGGGRRVVFEEIDSEAIMPVRESRMYWKHLRNSRR